MSKGQSNQNKRFDSFDQFTVEFDAALRLASEGKKPSALLKLLKQATGLAPTEDQVRLIMEGLHKLSNHSLLDFSLFSAARLGRTPSRLLVAVADRIGRDYADLVHFTHDVEPKTWSDIRDWISSLPLATGKPDDRSATATLARAAFGTLLQYQNRDFFNQAIVLLIARLARIKQKTGSGSTPIAVTVAGLLSRPVPNTSKLKLLLQCNNALKDELSDLQEGRRQMTLKAEALEHEVGDCKRSLAEAEAAREERDKRITLLTSRANDLEKQITSERQKLTNTEKHWEIVLDQKLAGLSSKMSVQLSHEIQEIEMCLDRKNPNTEMALQRVKRIGDIIRGLTEER